jgi:hypothetical protein
MRSNHPEPVPLNVGQVTTIKGAASEAHVSCDSVRRWCASYGIGRQLAEGGTWRVSVPALRMVVACDPEALEAFRRGDVTHPRVVAYLGNERARA